MKKRLEDSVHNRYLHRESVNGALSVFVRLPKLGLKLSNFTVIIVQSVVFLPSRICFVSSWYISIP